MRNQRTWTYLGNNGIHCIVGLFHSTKKGHLLIYCGKKIVVVDFKVFKNKTYSFFIDEELCHIHLKKDKKEQFTYEFEVDTEVDTPRNNARKEANRRETKYSIIAIVGVIIIVATILLGSHFWHKNAMQRQLTKQGVMTKGTLVVTEYSESYRYKYVYQTQTRLQTKPIEYFESAHPISSNGMPMHGGDEFYVTYVPNNPTNSEINFDQPTEKQLKKYYQRTLEVHQEHNPELSDEYCDCILNIAFKEKGITGYADFYFQKTSPSKNRLHNTSTYQTFIKTKSFLEAEEDCWQYR